MYIQNRKRFSSINKTLDWIIHTNFYINNAFGGKTSSIYYAYNMKNIFYDLLEYFTFLYSELIIIYIIKIIKLK